MSLVHRLLTPPPTRNHVPLPSTGRAGRNLPAAVGVAVVLIGAIVASLVVNKVAFVVLAVLAVCGALWELAGALARKDIRLPLPPLFLRSRLFLRRIWLARSGFCRNYPFRLRLR